MLNIRNFVITAHIDHGKSTLADRLLEATGTVEKRVMKPQYLDQLELERERGITIKMAPVRMVYHPHRRTSASSPRESAEIEEYILNLIDTPGHSDFGYEVSRALAAVEGAILLVDVTQGIQAQTLANLQSARKADLTIIGAINKIDAATPEQISTAQKNVAELLDIPENEILLVSGKTGAGVEELLDTILKKIPPPRNKFSPMITGGSRALVFDSHFDEHKGIIACVRVFDGVFEAQSSAKLCATETDFKIKEVGTFTPKLRVARHLQNGEIGYIATGIKNPDILKIGDTIIRTHQNMDVHASQQFAFPGYAEPNPVVFAAFYPEDPEQYDELRHSLAELRLNDAALRFEPDMNEILGRGFKGGFLGRLHFEITAARLKTEYQVETVHSFPSVAYQVKLHKDGWITITNPKDFPENADEVLEPMTDLEILTPAQYIGPVLQLKEHFRLGELVITTLGDKARITGKLPLADLISDFDDRLKSVSEGFASLSYVASGWQRVTAVKLEILVVESVVPGLTRILPKEGIEYIGRQTVQKLKDLLPRQQFTQAIQASVNNRIIARETLPAMRKDVTGYLYGGDRTRKMKLWKKQQKGKERLKERGVKNRVTIPASVFKELLKK